MGAAEGKARDTSEGSGTSGSNGHHKPHGVARGMTADDVTLVHNRHRFAHLRPKRGSLPSHATHNEDNRTSSPSPASMQNDTTQTEQGAEVTAGEHGGKTSNHNNNIVMNELPLYDHNISTTKKKGSRTCSAVEGDSARAESQAAGKPSAPARSRSIRLVSHSRGNSASLTNTAPVPSHVVRVLSPKSLPLADHMDLLKMPNTPLYATREPGHRAARSVPKHQVPELRQTVFTSLLAQSGFADTAPNDLSVLTSPPIPIASTTLLMANATDNASNHSISSIAESHHHLLSSTTSSQEPHTAHTLPVLLGGTREGQPGQHTIHPELLPPPQSPLFNATYSGYVSHANSSSTSVQVPASRPLPTTTTTTATTTAPGATALGQPANVVAVTSPTALAASPQECCAMSLLMPSNNVAAMSFSEVSLSNHGNSTASAYVPLAHTSLGNGAGGGSIHNVVSNAGSSLLRGPTAPSSVSSYSKQYMSHHTRHTEGNANNSSSMTNYNNNNSNNNAAASSWARLQNGPSTPMQADRSVANYYASPHAASSASVTTTTAVLGTGVGLTDVPYWGRHTLAQQQQQPSIVQAQAMQQQQQQRSTSMLGTFSQMSITDVELSGSLTIYLKKTVELARAMVREGLPFHFDHQRDVMLLYDLLGLDTDNEAEKEEGQDEGRRQEDDNEDDDDENDEVKRKEGDAKEDEEEEDTLYETNAAGGVLVGQGTTAYQRRLRRYRFPPPEMSQRRESAANDITRLEEETMAVQMLGRRELARRRHWEQIRQQHHLHHHHHNHHHHRKRNKGLEDAEGDKEGDSHTGHSASGSQPSLRQVGSSASHGHADPQSSSSHGDAYRLTSRTCSSSSSSSSTASSGGSGSTTIGTCNSSCSCRHTSRASSRRGDDDDDEQPKAGSEGKEAQALASQKKKKKEAEEAAAATGGEEQVDAARNTRRAAGHTAHPHGTHVHTHDFLLPPQGAEAGYTCMDEVHAHRRIVLARAPFLDSDDSNDENDVNEQDEEGAETSVYEATARRAQPTQNEAKEKQ